MARFIEEHIFAASLLLVDFDREAPFVVNMGTPLLNGSNVTTQMGWKRYATITYHWANPQERDNLHDLPTYGLKYLIPFEEGWSYEEPQQTQISPTIHLYNITVRATWHGSEKPAI